jgi:hypothetical protein
LTLMAMNTMHLLMGYIAFIVKMNNNNHIHLVLTHYFFDQIKAGKKKVEYRSIKEMWIKRILKNPNLEKVIFHRGYTSTIITKYVSHVDVGRYIGTISPKSVFKNHTANTKYIRIHLKSP